MQRDIVPAAMDFLFRRLRGSENSRLFYPAFELTTNCENGLLERRGRRRNASPKSGVSVYAVEEFR